MDKSLLFKLPYGICLVSSESKGNVGGCIVNTVIQITDEPTNLVVSITKDSHTASLMLESKKCIVGFISDKCNLNLIKHFSNQSGNSIKKFDSKYFGLFTYEKHNNIPYLTQNVVCNLICDIKEIVDVGSHYLFVLNLTETMEVSKEDKLMTYEQYRNMKSNTPSSYVCTVCHYVYDGITPFEELLHDYVCPICGQGKDVFIKVT